MKVSVLIPTYKRPGYLLKCLYSLEQQIRLPDEVIVVVRDNDIETQSILKDFIKGSKLNIKPTAVSKPGIIVAENEGLKKVTGDIVCFIDDDGTAYPDWIEKIEFHYINNSIGGIGGRTIGYKDGKPKLRKKVNKVGRIQWFGRIMGNHYQEMDNKIQLVDYFCGINMSFRRDLLKRVDNNLIGDARCFEMDMCLSVKAKGYKLLFDPAVVTNHFGAPRYSNERERIFDVVFVQGHNNTYVLLKHLNWLRKIVFLFYFFVIGDTSSPGLIKMLHLLLKYGVKPSCFPLSLMFHATMGKLKGIITYGHRSKGV